MPSQTLLAGAVASVNRTSGTGSWTNPTNAEGDNDNVASNATITNGAFSHWLRGTGFGFTVPATATLTGLQARWQVSGNNNRGGDSSVRFVLAGAETGSELAQAGSWPNALSFRSAGGDGDLLGTSLSVTNVNTSTFGLEVSGSRTASQAYTANVARLELTVFYTVPVVFNDSASGSVALGGSTAESWSRSFSDVPSGTAPVAGAASDSWSVGGGGPSFSDAPMGRLRVKA